VEAGNGSFSTKSSSRRPAVAGRSVEGRRRGPRRDRRPHHEEPPDCLGRDRRCSTRRTRPSVAAGPRRRDRRLQQGWPRDIMSSWVGGGPTSPLTRVHSGASSDPTSWASSRRRRASVTGCRLGAGLGAAGARQPDDAPGPGAQGTPSTACWARSWASSAALASHPCRGRQSAKIGRMSEKPAVAPGRLQEVGRREYLESIVVAVILALFIRTFAVQAFKIPTAPWSPTC